MNSEKSSFSSVTTEKRLSPTYGMPDPLVAANELFGQHSRSTLAPHQIFDYSTGMSSLSPLPILQIEQHRLGEGLPVFVIAEIGVNHNGDLAIAKQLIDVAKECGANAVKFQTFCSELLVSADTPMAKYQEQNSGRKESQLSMLKRLELNAEQHRLLREYCKRSEITFLSTPFDLKSLHLLRDLELPAYKIGSSDTDNIPFLIQIARIGRPMIVSSGMSDLQEIRESIEVLRPLNDKLVVLQCTTNYPCPAEDVHLRAMVRMRDELCVLVGFSDHTLGAEAAQIATLLGACVIEKHITLDSAMEGPDHRASSEPKEFAHFVKAIREAERVAPSDRADMIRRIKNAESYLGSPDKNIGATVSNSEVRSVAKKSVVAIADLPIGAVIDEHSIGVKRPGTGIRPKYFPTLVGKKLARSVRKDQALQWDDFETT